MKVSAVIRGGVAGGICAAVTLACIGRALAVTVPPWNWASMTTGYPGRAMETVWALIVLAPAGVVVGIAVAGACAFVFEHVTRRAGWTIGALVGAVCGTFGAALLGLIPWAASWFSYAYAPATLPLGPHDPAWSFVAVVAAGVVTGAVGGRSYGTVRRVAPAPEAVRWRQVYPPVSLRQD